jgi:hypothetical protein
VNLVNLFKNALSYHVESKEKPDYRYIIYELHKPEWWNFEYDEFSLKVGDEYDPETNRE